MGIKSENKARRMKLKKRPHGNIFAEGRELYKKAHKSRAMK